MFLSGWMIILVAPIVGSWLGVLVRRWPQGRPVALSRSACDSCHHELAPRDMVPLGSFLWLGGRCRYCGAHIGWFHPAIEFAALVVAVIVYFTDGGGWQGWIDAALGWALLTAAWIDAETYWLPDMITLPLIPVGLAVTWAEQPAAIYNHAAAAIAGYAAFWVIDEVYHALRHRHGLGKGDAKLLAAAGAWLGIFALPYVVFCAACIGIAMAVIIMRKSLSGGQRIAFGPALALSFFLARVLGSWVLQS